MGVGRLARWSGGRGRRLAHARVLEMDIKVRVIGQSEEFKKKVTHTHTHVYINERVNASQFEGLPVSVVSVYVPRFFGTRTITFWSFIDVQTT